MVVQFDYPVSTWPSTKSTTSDGRWVSFGTVVPLCRCKYVIVTFAFELTSAHGRSDVSQELVAVPAHFFGSLWNQGIPT
jgi:hypothetical protein